MYKQYKDLMGNIANAIIKIEDNTFIPFAPDNTDYQAYLKWLDEGGVPLPADE
jgi:hypothetical protein